MSDSKFRRVGWAEVVTALTDTPTPNPSRRREGSAARRGFTTVHVIAPSVQLGISRSLLKAQANLCRRAIVPISG